MKTSTKRFFRKIDVFFRRNALAVIICVATVLMLSIIASATYYSVTSGTEEPATVDNLTVNISKPVSSSDPIVFVAPLDNITISKEYAADHLLEDKTTGIWQTHQALDFAATDGEAVSAVYSGIIENIENSMMEGTIITLKISDNIRVIYKSLTSETLVSIGDKVSAGQDIGYVGTNVTEKAEGVHLHLEVTDGGNLVDPNLYFGFTDK